MYDIVFKFYEMSSQQNVTFNVLYVLEDDNNVR